MAGTFHARITELIETVGESKLHGYLKIDQPYVKAQHYNKNLKHPTGGKPGFLTDPLFQGYKRWYQDMANDLYKPNGLQRAMVKSVKTWRKNQVAQTPKFFGDLAQSGEARVKDHGRIVYRTPVFRRRLTRAELRAKTRIWDEQYDHDGNDSK